MTALENEPRSAPPAPKVRRTRDLDPAPGGTGADAAGGLGFPDIPRLELDQLLVQLADRADDVRATQGRLRGLLRANALVAGELSLPVVLRQIVGAARDLLGVRYATLGVLGSDGGLEQFVHAGMDEELVGLQQFRAAPAGLYARRLAIIEEHAPQLGFAAAIRFAGPLDPSPDAALAHDILAVTREALSNCARHAHATAASASPPAPAA